MIDASFAMAEQIDLTVDSWKSFLTIQDRLDELKWNHECEGRLLKQPLFRGLGNSGWKLETTLDRSPDAMPNETLLSYYRRVTRSKPVIESLMGRNWDDIPHWPALRTMLDDDRSNWLDRTLAKNPSIYQYLIYLRHHGFPSPLLDWTTSPFLALMFAFDSIDKSTEYVTIYAFFGDSFSVHDTSAHLFFVGPYLRTHPRHYFQQSRYSLCVAQMPNVSEDLPIDYVFRRHSDVLAQNYNRDLLVRIIIPASERRQILMQLDAMNVNPYTLYGSEESLIRTIARREMLFNPEFVG
jgi:hypothetical protein